MTKNYGLDNRVATHEAFRALENSQNRLENAMERSATGARDAATLSRPEVRDEILNKAGSDGDYKALDAVVYETAVKMAAGHDSGQVGTKEIAQAVASWKGVVTKAAKGDGFLGASNDATTAGLKTIYAAAQQAEKSAAAYAQSQATDPKKGA